MNYFQTAFNQACKSGNLEKADELYTKTKHLSAIDIHYDSDSLIKTACIDNNLRVVEFLYNMGLIMKKPFSNKILNDIALKVSEDTLIQLLEYFDVTDTCNVQPEIKLINPFAQSLKEKIDYITETYNVRSNHVISGNQITNGIICTESEFLTQFGEFTGHMFDKIDWSNIVIAGGFIFGILNKCHNSMLEGSDIDLFVFGKTEEIRKKKCDYLLDYFRKYYKAHYIETNSIITIINPNIKHDIQIIMINKETPLDIINEFDFNYVKTYYDGKTVQCTPDCIYAFEYQIAVVDDAKPNLNKRLYKTHHKGLWIATNSKLKSELITDRNHLDLTKLENDMEFTSSLNKQVLIRELYGKCPTNKLIKCIEILYDVPKVHLEIPVKATNISSSSFDKYISDSKGNGEVEQMLWTYDKTTQNIATLVRATAIFNTSEKHKHITNVNLKVNNKIYDPYMELDICTFKQFDDDTLSRWVINCDLSDKSKWMLKCFTNNIKRLCGNKIKGNNNPFNLVIHVTEEQDSWLRSLKSENIKINVHVKVFKMNGQMRLKFNTTQITV